MVPLPTLWALAKAWYHDRLAADFSRLPAAAAQAVFENVGLTGRFWQL